MATLTLMIDKRNKKATKYPLVIRLQHKALAKFIQLGFKLSENEWNDKKTKIKPPFKNANRANIKVEKKMLLASEVLSDYADSLKNLTIYEVADIIKQKLEKGSEQQLDKTIKNNKETTLVSYGQKIIDRYEKAARFRSADTFKDAMDQIFKYRLNDDNLWRVSRLKTTPKSSSSRVKLQKVKDSILITDLDSTFFEDFEAFYLSKINSRGKNNTLNSLGVHLRALRRIYNLAVQDKATEVTEAHYPFGKGGYSIKRQSTKKRAINIDVLKSINKLDYKKESALWHHRNYFLFSFYVRGMNFIDLAYLTKDSIQNGRLVYKRRKTKRGATVKEFNIKIPLEAQDVLNYYIKKERKGNLVFPILEDVINCEDGRKIYDVYSHRIKNHNRRLNTISKAIGLNQNLTTYVARHTFATAGLRKGISKAQIGDMLGHTNYYTTEAYLSDFDNEVLDEAAEKIFE